MERLGLLAKAFAHPIEGFQELPVGNFLITHCRDCVAGAVQKDVLNAPNSKGCDKEGRLRTLQPNLSRASRNCASMFVFLRIYRLSVN